MNREWVNDINSYITQKHYRLINSLLAYQNGELIFEQYYNNFDKENRHNIKSIWKSILSVCTGICLEQGYIKNLDEPIMNYLPPFGKGLHTYHKLITIRHLLTMSSGIYWNGGVHYHCPMIVQLMRSENWLEYLVDIAMADVPGTRFVYKEWDVMLLSSLLEKASGISTYELCRKYLYQPLEIQSGIWGRSSCGIDYTIIDGMEDNSNLSARDLAKLGHLFLNLGCHQGNRILSENYIRQAISPSKGNESYGFLWWLFPGGYGCRGYGGQEISVIPEKNLVVVIQAKATPQCKSYGDVPRRLIELI